MSSLLNIVLKKKLFTLPINVKCLRMLNTGLHKVEESDCNTSPIPLPLHQVEKDVIITERDLLLPNGDDIRIWKKTARDWSLVMINRLESIDYAVLITSGINQTQLILSRVRLSTSDTPASTNKLTTTINSSREEIEKKWAVVKEKLPAWQDDIAHKLQRLQDYINKKFIEKKG